MIPPETKLSPNALAVLMVGFLYGSTLILNPGGGAGHDAWIAVLLGMGEGLLIATAFVLLSSRFQGQTLVEICRSVYGPVLGNILSALFIWYLFHLGSLVLNNFSRFFALIMPETPKLALILPIMLVCVSAVKKGAETLTRCAQIFVPLTTVLIIFSTMMLINKINLQNLAPVMEVPGKKLFWAAHGAATFPFAETVAFLMLLQALEKGAKPFTLVLKAFIFATLFLILIVIFNTGVLGATAEAFLYPSFEAARNINIGNTLNRVDIIVAINFLTMGFLKISVLLYGSALGTAQLFRFRSHRPLVFPLGILMILLEILDYQNTPQMVEFAQKYYPIYALPFQLGIPLLTLIMAFLRGLPRKGRER
ncbi:GerAB/ArcD/ProY family transporter [Candidatus Formimonas warabiya]|uniref:GerAB/ArcD/ProY family transporter n=1 Tax=Formimonas warabiya TaxID=1761012 RepID=A0A3G1KRR7_FORW1|nr:endospore germination permease [Candidatus Formimonas warabiya]ATW25148.1 hypothetical protein DCMF_10545 [Candidatus Formimonas warabiya]